MDKITLSHLDQDQLIHLYGKNDLVTKVIDKVIRSKAKDVALESLSLVEVKEGILFCHGTKVSEVSSDSKINSVKTFGLSMQGKCPELSMILN